MNSLFNSIPVFPSHSSASSLISLTKTAIKLTALTSLALVLLNYLTAPTSSPTATATRMDIQEIENNGNNKKRSKRGKSKQRKEETMEMDGTMETTSKGGDYIDSPQALKIEEAYDGTILRSSRVAEKNLLILLNKRFAAVIEKNRQLELANQKLTHEFEVSEQNHKETVTELKTKVNEQLKDARDELAEAKKANQNLNFALDNLKHNIEDLNSQLEKSIDLNGNQQKIISDFEQRCDQLQNNLNKEAGLKKKLQKQLKDSEEEKAKLMGRLNDLNNQYETECMAKVDLESQLKGEVEEMCFKATIVETEMIQMKAKTEEQLKKMDEQNQKDYEDKLDKSMGNLRQEYERKLKENKKEQEALFQMKESDYFRKSQTLASELEEKLQELDSNQTKVETLLGQICTLEGDKAGLEKKLVGADKERQAEKDKLEKKIRQKEEEAEEVREEKAKLLDQYRDLLDIKVALDSELATYRALLETEESRLQITLAELLKDENNNLEKQPDIIPIN